MELFLPIICSAAIISLIGALIFNKSFRADILSTENEANIFGILSVKGVAVIVLLGLFLGGLIYSFSNVKEEESTQLMSALAKLQSSQLNEINLRTKSIETSILDFYTDEYVPNFAEQFTNSIPEETDLDVELKRLIEQSSSNNISSFRDSMSQLNDLKDECYTKTLEYHSKILQAARENNQKKYDSLFNNRPKFLVSLTNLEEKVLRLPNNQYKLNYFSNYVNQYLDNE